MGINWMKRGISFLMNVRNSAEQMNQLIEDLLAYSRMERREIQPVSIDLSAMIDCTHSGKSAGFGRTEH